MHCADPSENDEEQLYKIKSHILQLPKENQALLKELLKLTKDIIRNFAHNKMNLSVSVHGDL